MRYTIIALKRSNTDARAMLQQSYENLKGRYVTVRTYPDGIVSYDDAPGIVYWVKILKVPEAQPFFNLGVFVQKLNEQPLPLHPTTLEPFIKYMKSK